MSSLWTAASTLLVEALNENRIPHKTACRTYEPGGVCTCGRNAFVDRLGATLASGEADSKRLDWLEAHAQDLYRRIPNTGMPQWSLADIGEGEDYDKTFDAATIREVVDAAISAAAAPVSAPVEVQP